MKTPQQSVPSSRLELLCALQQQVHRRKQLMAMVDKLEHLMKERLIELDEIGAQLK